MRIFNPDLGLGRSVAAGMAILGGLLYFSAPAAADVVYFKDGMRTVCQDKAWEQNAEVHCEYAGGLLIYPAADILRIEKSLAPRRPSAQTDDDPDAPPPAAGAASSTPQKTESKKQAVPNTPGVSGTSGLLFYDPRRPKKYWSSPSRHHDTFTDAVAALADEFGRTPQWVERQLNDANDLGELRTHLQSQLSGGPAAAGPVEPSAEGIKFYDPRRSKKYQTDPDTSHLSYNEALEAFAREFQSPADWIERNMGESNQLETIRQNLINAQKAAKSNAGDGSAGLLPRRLPGD